jgi:hypothetical protein
MSTTPSAQPTPVVAVPPRRREIKIYSHSTLFYWWPVWFFGFIMFLITYFDGSLMIVVPKDTKAEKERIIPGHDGPRDVYVLPKDYKIPVDDKGEPVLKKLHMSRSPRLGVIFTTVLLVIIFISNVPLRGLWSFLIILFILLLVVIFALWGVWEDIIAKLSLIDIRINAGGYFFVSFILFVIWAVTIFIFDHRTYVAITPGQVRMCLAVGAGETVYDTTGMTFQKKQDDLFRHWIIGLGSGDLIMHRSGTREEIDMPNVLFIGAKIKEIEQMIKEKEVV